MYDPEQPGALPPAPAQPPDPEGWAVHWARRVGDGATMGERAILLDLIRTRRGRVYDWLVRHDTAAAETMVARRMAPPADARREGELAIEWDDAGDVCARVASILAPMPDGSPPNAGKAAASLMLLRALIARHAPQHLALVPERPPGAGGDLTVPDPVTVEIPGPRHGYTPARPQAEPAAESIPERENSAAGPFAWS